jgi:hypothetical protein
MRCLIDHGKRRATLLAIMDNRVGSEIGNQRLREAVVSQVAKGEVNGLSSALAPDRDPFLELVDRYQRVQSGGCSFYRGALYTILRNPIYIGQIRHKRVCHPGEHEAIIDPDTWERVQTLLSAQHRGRVRPAPKSAPSPLATKLFDEDGERLTPSHAVNGTRRYRYYVSHRLIEGKADRNHHGWRLPAVQIEQIVALAARQMLDDSAAVLDAIQTAEVPSRRIPEIMQTASAWSSRLESATEFSSAVALLVDRVDLSTDRFRLGLKLPTQLATKGKAADPAVVPYRATFLCRSNGEASS